MSGTILIKRSAVAQKVPTTAQMSIGELSVNTFDGKLYLRGNNGTDYVIPIGAPAQRGGANWQAVSGMGAVQNFEFDELVYLFSQAQNQSLTLWVKVPTSYTIGRQINLKLGQYSPGTSNNFKLQTVATVIRKGTDAINSVVNQRTSTAGDTSLSTAFLYQEIVYDLTDVAGKVNGVVVNPEDILKVLLTRVSPTGTEDSNDCRMIPSSTEITF